jgi:hypothetical protein
MARVTTSLLVAVALAARATLAQEKPAPEAPVVAPRQLNLESKPWRGDFDALLERRMIRVLVPYSRTLFFVDKGRERASRPSWRATSSAT